jgi:hypothetical protein
VNAHLWPKHTKGEDLLPLFGVDKAYVNHHKNYLRLTKSLELAFDSKAITIIEKDNQLLLFVLDASLMNEQVENTRFKFMDCHQWPLQFGNANRPFLRMLSAHCHHAFVDAFQDKRIDYNTYRMGYESSISMINSLPEGHKAKVLQWFKRNEIVEKNEKS